MSKLTAANSFSQSDCLFRRLSFLSHIDGVRIRLYNSREIGRHGIRMILERKLRILVAEDNEISRYILSRQIVALGHDVIVARNGIEAVELAASQPYDLALMDIEMPGMNGIEATKKIRRHAAQTSREHIPIIAVTAHALVGDAEHFLSQGLDGYLTKPYSRSDLKKVIANFGSRYCCH